MELCYSQDPHDLCPLIALEALLLKVSGKTQQTGGFEACVLHSCLGSCFTSHVLIQGPSKMGFKWLYHSLPKEAAWK